MNYNKLYSRFIESRLVRIKKRNDGLEDHHILPVSLGGSNDQSNLITLTFREHFIAHRILAKMFDGKKRYQMTYALDRMMKSNCQKLKESKITSRTFDYIKIQISKVKSKQWKNTKFKKLMKEKISATISNLWQDPEYRAKQMASKVDRLAKAKAGMRKAWTTDRKNTQLPNLWKSHKSWWNNLTEDQKIIRKKKNSEALKKLWAKKRSLLFY